MKTHTTLMVVAHKVAIAIPISVLFLDQYKPQTKLNQDALFWLVGLVGLKIAISNSLPNVSSHNKFYPNWMKNSVVKVLKFVKKHYQSVRENPQ